MSVKVEALQDFHLTNNESNYQTKTFECFVIFIKMKRFCEALTQKMINAIVWFDFQIGLDFTPWFAPTQQDRDDQMNVFIKQLSIAKELDLPVWAKLINAQLSQNSEGHWVLDNLGAFECNNYVYCSVTQECQNFLSYVYRVVIDVFLFSFGIL